jgi:hypothetical protein
MVEEGQWNASGLAGTGSGSQDGNRSLRQCTEYLRYSGVNR